ncbi:uncharacterized protein LOC135682059 [Rhopilema esculentum]|uniref:uncharacterized protein LOC135682059 n=1 Tax=Rhopilema esculentum TaxID=499914 RepID=UPI0031D8F1B1
MDILVAQDTVPRISFLRNTLFILLVCFSAFTSAVTVDANTKGCGGTYSGTYGNFTSPGYPSRYADNLRCRWTIKVSQNSRIHIDFIYVEIETGDGCLYDYLLFRDGLEPTSPALAKICHAHTTTIKSTGSEMTVLFVTDSSTGFRGFHLVWKAVPKMPLLQPEGISITSPWIGIATPKSLRQIDGGITEHLWAVDKTSTVYLYANRIWDAVEGKMAYVTAGPVVIGTSEDGYVWYRKGITSELPKGNAWERVPILIRMQRVESGRNGVAVGLDLLGNLHQLQISENRPTGLAWKILDGDKNDPLIDVSCGSYACWFTTLKGVLYLSRDIGFDEQADSSPQLISPERVGAPFAAKQVAAGFDGSLWAITSSGDAYKRIGVSMIKPEGTSWQKLEKVSFEQITVGLMGVYGLTKSGIIITMEEHKCGGILTAKKGMFASPDYPNVYPANMTCLWIIRVPDAEGILVQFMKLVAIGRTSVCRDDHLVSYEDGKYSSKSEPVIECGDKVEDKYFTGNEVWIEFKSGTTNRGFGFQAVYDAWFNSAITSQGPLKESTKITTPATIRKQTQTIARTISNQVRTRASSQANTQTYGITSDAKMEPSSMFTEVVKSEKSMTTKNNEFSVTTKEPSTQGKTKMKDSDLQPPSTQHLVEISTKATSHTQRVSTAPSTRMAKSTNRMPSVSILSTHDDGTTHAVSTNPQLKSEQSTMHVDLSTAPSSAAPLVPSSSSGTKAMNKMVPSVDPESPQVTRETTKSSTQTEAPSISSGTKAMNKMVPSVDPESPQVTRETTKSSTQTEAPSISSGTKAMNKMVPSVDPESPQVTRETTK